MLQNKKIFFFLGLYSVLLFFGCRQKTEWHKTTFLFFDTVCQVQIQAGDATFTQAKQAIHDVFSQIEKNFSPGSVDYKDPEVLKLFRTAYQIYRHSEGSFDPSVAPLSELWGFRSGNHRLPSSEEITTCLRCIGMDKVKINNGTLMVPENMTLDWGGIAKGWGIDSAYQECKKMNIPSGFINAGGDLYCWGVNPDHEDWKIGITHPRQKGFLGILRLSYAGAATTGDYQRCFFFKGTRYHHILNPDTGRPARGKQSVTVVGPETAVCDGLATALFVSEDPEKILMHFPEYGAILVMENGDEMMLGHPVSFRKN
jgi:FAD:protein FMN transferase